MRAALPGLLAISVTILSSGALADESDLTPLDTTLPDSFLEERAQFLVERLDDSQLHGQIWWYSWLTVNSISAVGLGTAAALTGDHDDRVKNATNATKAAIGLTRMIFDPLEARLGADKIRPLLSDTRERRIAKLRAAEAQLQRNALRAEQRWSWQDHLGNAAINGAAGALVATLGETGDAYEVGVGGFIGGLAFLLTQPWDPDDHWEQYKGLRSQESRLRVYVTQLPDGGAGLNLNLRW